MNKFDESAAALEDRDLSGAQVEDRRRNASVVQSVRFSRELTERLMAEAARRGCTPSEAIRDLVEAGLSSKDGTAPGQPAVARRGIAHLAPPAPRGGTAGVAIRRPAVALA